MASGIVQTGLIEKVQINNSTEHKIASTAYGVCSTDATQAAKTVQIDGFELITGVTIHVKFTHDNTATDPPTLNVNGTGAINIAQYSNIAAGIVSETSGWQAGAVLSLTYDGTYWIRDQGYNTNTTYPTLTQALVNTGTEQIGKLVTAKIMKDTVTNAINDLDVSNISGFGTGKTLATLTETDGKISATFQNISITKSQISDFPEITAASLGLTNILIYKGPVQSLPEATSQSTYSNYDNGNVISVGSKEYAYLKGETALASSWVELGDEGSYKLKQNVIINSTGEADNSGNTSINFVYSFSQTDEGVVSVKTRSLPTASTNNAGIIQIGTTADDAAAGNHSHTLKIGNKSLSVSTSQQTWNLHDILYNESAIQNNTSWDITTPGVYEVASSVEFTGTNHPEAEHGGLAPYRYGQLIVSRAGTGGIVQFYIANNASDTGNGIKFRSGSNSNYSNTWRSLLDDVNYKFYGWQRPATITDGQVVLSSGTDGTTTLRAITNNTSATAVTTSTNLITENTLYYYIGSANISTVGTITSGTWQGTAIDAAHGGTGNDSFTQNRLVYSELTTKLNSTTSIYASTDAITINGTTAPDNNGKFQVNGISTFQHIYTQTNATYDIGTTTTRWNNTYISNSLLVGAAQNTAPAYNSNILGTYIGPGIISSCVTSADNGYYLFGNGTQYARLSINIIGTVNTTGQTILELGNNIATATANNARGCVRIYHTNTGYADYYSDGWQSNGSVETFTMLGATSNTADTDAWTTLVLGNNSDKATTTAHSQGRIQIYASNTNYTDIRSQGNGSQIFYLPNYNDTMYAIHAGDNNAVGSTTQPVYIAANGRVTTTSYSLSASVNSGTANRLAYYSGVNALSATGHYSSSDKLGVNYTSGTEPTQNFYVNGTSYFNGSVTHNGSIYFSNGTTYYIDNSAVGYLSDIRVDNVRLDDNKIEFYQNANASGTCYGTIQVTDATHMLLHLNDSASNNVFDFNGSIVPAITNTYNLGSATNHWQYLYLDNNLIMKSKTIETRPYTSNKITWSADGKDVEIYCSATSADQSQLVLNTNVPGETLSSNANAVCLIALAHEGSISAYFNTKSLSFYPASNGTGSLGTDTNRWASLFVGESNSYGDPYQPIYWNNGLPAMAHPVQFFSWTIESGNLGVEFTNSTIFKSTTYNIQLVITAGEYNLQAPLTWESVQSKFRITTTLPVSGDVTGYAIVARGTDIRQSLSAAQITPPQQEEST